jgi:RNA polymerase sigma factor (sigma-70 family)
MSGLAPWNERCASLFEEMWRPARAMVARAYGKALSDEEIKDVYSAAWTATLSALRVRGDSMTNEELRSYILTAVASHASKEMRRRARKPAGSLDDAQEQLIADGHQLLPEERVIGAEARGIARDLLSSLPPRRRAVMLLRYGWGLRPAQVCNLVAGLSPRAYRKEITKGVEQLIERLELVDSGEWCRSRKPLLREYVAGTADPEVKRQAEEHLDHCRACAEFAARLGGHLHELGGLAALAASTGLVTGSKAGLLERASDALLGARETAAEVLGRAASNVGTLASSGVR